MPGNELLLRGPGRPLKLGDYELPRLYLANWENNVTYGPLRKGRKSVQVVHDAILLHGFPLSTERGLNYSDTSLGHTAPRISAAERFLDLIAKGEYLFDELVLWGVEGVHHWQLTGIGGDEEKWKPTLAVLNELFQLWAEMDHTKNVSNEIINQIFIGVESIAAKSCANVGSSALLRAQNQTMRNRFEELKINRGNGDELLNTAQNLLIGSSGVVLTYGDLLEIKSNWLRYMLDHSDLQGQSLEVLKDLKAAGASGLDRADVEAEVADLQLQVAGLENQVAFAHKKVWSGINESEARMRDNAFYGNGNESPPKSDAGDSAARGLESEYDPLFQNIILSAEQLESRKRHLNSLTPEMSESHWLVANLELRNHLAIHRDRLQEGRSCLESLLLRLVADRLLQREPRLGRSWKYSIDQAGLGVWDVVDLEKQHIAKLSSDLTVRLYDNCYDVCLDARLYGASRDDIDRLFLCGFSEPQGYSRLSKALYKHAQRVIASLDEIRAQGKTMDQLAARDPSNQFPDLRTELAYTAYKMERYHYAVQLIIDEATLLAEQAKREESDDELQRDQVFDEMPETMQDAQNQAQHLAAEATAATAN